jgi:cell division transport system ATP-binding protein
MKSTLLKVENLSKSYVQGETVWRNVTFELGRGDFLYILGGSGAGKSSLLRTIASFEEPTGGRVVCQGIDVGSAGRSELERLRRSISFIPQNLGLISDLTVEDQLEMSRTGVRPRERAEDSVLKNVILLTGLGDKLRKRVSTLSGGERQRVAILRALTRKVELLIADEPTGAQDFEMTWKLMDMFVKLNLSGASLVLATHDLEMVRRLRKRCAILKDGQFKVEERP